MGTSYAQVYNRFLQKITDYKLLQLADDDIQQLLHGYLVSAITKFKKCKSDLSKRDDDIAEFEEELLDIEIEILALQMVSEWVTPQLNNVLYTKQFVGTNEEKFFAQSNHLDKLMALQKDSADQSRRLRRDYSFQNTTYFDR